MITVEDIAHTAGALSARCEQLEWELTAAREYAASVRRAYEGARADLATAHARIAALEELARGPAPRPSVRP